MATVTQSIELQDNVTNRFNRIEKWFSQADFIGENASKPPLSANSETKTSVPAPALTKSGGNAE